MVHFLYKLSCNNVTSVSDVEIHIDFFMHLQASYLWRISVCISSISLFIMGELKNRGYPQLNSLEAQLFFLLQ